MVVSPDGCCRIAQNSGNSPIRAHNFPNQGRTATVSPLLMALLGPQTASQVDIHGFVWYMPALRVKSQAFRRLFTLPESDPIN
jgi:hypothetical protein